MSDAAVPKPPPGGHTFEEKVEMVGVAAFALQTAHVILSRDPSERNPETADRLARIVDGLAPVMVELRELARAGRQRTGDATP